MELALFALRKRRYEVYTRCCYTKLTTNLLAFVVRFHLDVRNERCSISFPSLMYAHTLASILDIEKGPSYMSNYLPLLGRCLQDMNELWRWKVNSQLLFTHFQKCYAEKCWIVRNALYFTSFGDIYAILKIKYVVYYHTKCSYVKRLCRFVSPEEHNNELASLRLHVHLKIL